MIRFASSLTTYALAMANRIRLACNWLVVLYYYPMLPEIGRKERPTGGLSHCTHCTHCTQCTQVTKDDR